MNNSGKPSDVINNFIEYLKDIEEKYKEAKKQCAFYDSHDRQIDWEHKFEFAKNKSERNKLATAYQQERKKRREYKDIVDLYENIVRFVSSEQNKPTLNRMKSMISKQISKEEYLDGDRVYKKRSAGETKESEYGNTRVGENND